MFQTAGLIPCPHKTPNARAGWAQPHAGKSALIHAVFPRMTVKRTAAVPPTIVSIAVPYAERLAADCTAHGLRHDREHRRHRIGFPMRLDGAVAVAASDALAEGSAAARCPSRSRQVRRGATSWRVR